MVDREKIYSKRVIAICIGAAVAMPAAFGFQKTKAPDVVVVLDANTFDSATYQSLQSTANQVAEVIDELIPGVPTGYKQSIVFCYNNPVKQPITTIGPNKPAEYPQNLPIENVRIGLGVTPGGYNGMLAFQLAHELAHIKMGALKDNYLVELFAVAVQLEVLKELGFTELLALEFRDAKSGWELKWTSDVYMDILWHNEKALAQYWQSQQPALQKLHNSDWEYARLSIGALVIADHGQLQWAKLLNISDLSVACHPMSNGSWPQECQPNTKSLLTRQPVLKALGY